MKSGILMLVLILAAATIGAERPPAKGACLVCHRLRTPGLYADWLGSAHARNGVTCLDCHEALASDPDAFRHGGADISLFVTPRDCSGCHEVETTQYARSGHAGTAVDLERLDARGAASYGDPQTCSKCHGGESRSAAKRVTGRTPVARPEHGVGRINQDGSLGACSACHAEHKFSRAVARSDSTCVVCHTRDHAPQHVGKGASAAGRRPGVPALDGRERCAACHLSAGRRQPVTHFIKRR